LIREAQERVRKGFGIELQCEVVLLERTD